LERLRRTAPHPLLPASIRPLAAALAGFCVVLTVVFGTWFAGQTGPGWLDSSVDGRVQGLLGSHPKMFYVVSLGAPVSVTIISAALLVACLAMRRGRGAVLVAVAVPAAAALTELLKPVVDRAPYGISIFPSGHSTGIFAVVVAFAVLLIDPPRPRIRVVVRVLLALIALLTAVTVAVALVAVRWHYATDTVAGAAVGTAVVLATALALDLVCALGAAGRLSSRRAAEWMGRRAPRIGRRRTSPD